MSSRFNILDTPIDGLKIIERLPIYDSRGYLERIFCIEELNVLLSGKNIMQINHTQTANVGTIRGLHFQKFPDTEIKLVTCLRGEIYDVAVDLRTGSESYLKYHAEILNQTNHKSFFIPEGFAHGFQTLTDNCEILYLHTAVYKKDSEGGLNIFDPKIGIKWPLPMKDISDRDRCHPFIIS